MAEKIYPKQKFEEVNNPFPYKNLGMFGNVISAIGGLTNAPPPMILTGLLCATALTSQEHIVVKALVDHQEYNTSLFGLNIAESGAGKSTIDNIILKPIRDQQKKLKSEYIQQIEEYKVNHKIWSEKLKSSKVADNLGYKKLLEEEPKKPNQKIYLFKEGTIEGITNFLMYQKSIGIFSDDGGTLFGGYSFNKDNIMKACAYFCDRFNSGILIKTTKMDGIVDLYDRTLSLYLQIQPNIKREILKIPSMKEQGFLARCLISEPYINKGNNFFKDIDEDNKAFINNTITKYSDIIVDRLNHPKSEDKRIITYNKEGYELIKFKHNQLVKEQQIGGKYHLSSAYAQRNTEIALRVSANLLWYEDPYQNELTIDHITNGFAICEYYLNEANRIINQNHEDYKEEQAKKLLSYLDLKSKDNEELRVNDLRRNIIRDKRTLEECLMLLSDMNLVLISDSKPRTVKLCA